MGQFIWKKKGWHKFSWNSRQIAVSLGKARKLQGEMIGQAKLLGIEVHADFVTEEAIQTSAIEGEAVDRSSVRSSVARKLGMPTAGLPKSHRTVDGLVSMLIDATSNHRKPLTKDRTDRWHAALFPTGYTTDLRKIRVGNWRDDSEGPMQVVSKEGRKEVVHYQAPPANHLKNEFQVFKKWWDSPPDDLDGIVRAAIAHLWFVTLHPYDDGNGRIARAITDMALAQDEKSPYRLYSISAQIIKDHEKYYEVLEKTQKGGLDITEWIEFFLELFIRALESSKKVVRRTLLVSKFWAEIKNENLNERQTKVVNRLLESGPDGFEGKLSNKNYVSIAKTSRETAKRDLAELVEKGILSVEGKGRGVRYSLIFKSVDAS